MKNYLILTLSVLTLILWFGLSNLGQAQTSFSCTDVAEIPQTECAELTNLYINTNGDSWTNNDGWLISNTPCQWHGITCSGGQVTEISLIENQLTGTLSDLNNLPRLQVLDLYDNQLGGPVPAFSNLSDLRQLWLNNNQLSGTIPNFSSLPSLTELNLSGNKLSGPIPNFNGLPSLDRLLLYNNQLSGSIPDFSSVPNLIELDLNSNELTSAIPSFSNLPNLTKLRLDSNLLSGPVPDLNWSSFEFLRLRNNCGLVALNDAQATALSSQDPNWQTRNSACSGTATPTPSPSATSIPPTPTATLPPPSGDGDAYEADDTCDLARPIPADGRVQDHTFHVQADVDWVRFEAISGTTYLIQGLTPGASQADLVLEAYDQCGGTPSVSPQDLTFTPDIRLEFNASQSGFIYLKVRNSQADQFGELLNYQLSVRALGETASPGAVVIVAGKIKPNDHLQDNIYHVTDSVYAMFEEQDYPTERIYYLAPSNDDQTVSPGYPITALATVDNVQAAITQWAPSMLGPDQPFTLFMMDHGDSEQFYLDKRAGEWITPNQLNDWLSELESARPGVRINLFIEACKSGSFITNPQSVSGQGRLVVTSSEENRLAKASKLGAIFSDQFIAALSQKQSIYYSFLQGVDTTNIARSSQSPQIDGNGNGIPNEEADFQIAAQRGFGYAGTLISDEWPPYISQVQPPSEIKQGAGLIEAKVADDEQVKSVWMIVYPPSYTPPSDEGDEMITELQPTVPLTERSKGQYAINYANFTESGTYRVVIHAEDNDGLTGQPVSVEFTVNSADYYIYLPLVVK